MTREEIIRMAREAGYGLSLSDMHAPALERFAALVAAAEREACAAICAREARHYGKIQYLGHYQQGRGDGACAIEKKIRARGQE